MIWHPGIQICNCQIRCSKQWTDLKVVHLLLPPYPCGHWTIVIHGVFPKRLSRWSATCGGGITRGFNYFLQPVQPYIPCDLQHSRRCGQIIWLPHCHKKTLLAVVIPICQEHHDDLSGYPHKSNLMSLGLKSQSFLNVRRRRVRSSLQWHWSGSWCRGLKLWAIDKLRTVVQILIPQASICLTVWCWVSHLTRHCSWAESEKGLWRSVLCSG